MTDQRWETMRGMLHKLRDDLEAVAETSDAAAATVTLDQSRMGRLSRMDALQAQAISVDAKRRREAQLAGVVRALQRIDNQKFGFCTSCGEEIAARRLEFDPTIAVCIDCAQAAEE